MYMTQIIEENGIVDEIKTGTLVLKKKFTGKKIKIAEDLLHLKGKGGCYCFMPYENTDDNNKALFKIGMTLDFTSRLDDPSRQYCYDV
jgi:uncharacterized membrane-anchored protein